MTDEEYTKAMRGARMIASDLIKVVEYIRKNYTKSSDKWACVEPTFQSDVDTGKVVPVLHKVVVTRLEANAMLPEERAMFPTYDEWEFEWVSNKEDFDQGDM